MKNDRKKLPIELAAVSLIFSLLFFSRETVSLASRGLLIWYRNLIPALFPFMVLSGFLVNTGAATRLIGSLSSLLPIAFLKPSMIYTIIMGLLCGFPMGAKVVADQMKQGQLTLEEGQYLLAFCNHIGPLYMVGYVLPLFRPPDFWSCLLVFYGIPLIYGLFFLKKPPGANSIAVVHSPYKGYLEGFQTALQAAVEQITLLGGCMVFFNCLLIYPLLFTEALERSLQGPLPSFLYPSLACLTEIGSGLEAAAATGNFPLPLVFSLLSFTGLGCIIQTCFIVKNTRLSIRRYLFHKTVQSLIIYLLLSLLVGM